MLFNSYEFLFLFLPVVWIGNELLLRAGLRRASMAFLVVASGIFYATWNVQLIVLLLASLLVNFQVGRWLNDLRSVNERSMRGLLILGVAFNLGLLGYFKYANFLVNNANAVFGLEFVLGHIVLPIGIY